MCRGRVISIIQADSLQHFRVSETESPGRLALLQRAKAGYFQGAQVEQWQAGSEQGRLVLQITKTPQESEKNVENTVEKEKGWAVQSEPDGPKKRRAGHKGDGIISGRHSILGHRRQTGRGESHLEFICCNQMRWNSQKRK